MRRQIKRERRKYLVNAWIHNDTNRLCQRSGTRNEWKVVLVTNENAEIRRIEQLMAENQNKNWNIIEEPFSTIGRNFHILSDCKQTLYSKQQLIYNLDTVASLLNLVYAEVMSYKVVLYALKKQSFEQGAHMAGSEIDNIFDGTRVITTRCLEISL